MCIRDSANTVAAGLDVWVGNVVDSRNAGYTPDFTDCVKYGDMSGRHRHDAFGVSFEYLSCKPFGNLFTVADDKQPCGYTYTFRNCTGFENGKTQYISSEQSIQFVRKNEDGSVIPGLQNVQRKTPATFSPAPPVWHGNTPST